VNRRRNWELSSSNLRICLRLFAMHDMYIETGVAQFEWIVLQHVYYLFNRRSQLILASVTRQTNPNVVFIRYRLRSRYRPIIEKWANSTPIPPNFERVAVASTQLGRWERRMARMTRGTFSRSEAIDELQLNVPVYDRLQRRRSRRRQTVTRMSPLQQMNAVNIARAVRASNELWRRIQESPPSEPTTWTFTEASTDSVESDDSGNFSVGPF
jgi:hypothetical protein